MKFKLYTILSFILIFIIGFSFFFSSTEEITIHLIGMQNSTTLPLSLWIAICLFLFYLFTLAFFATRSFSSYLTSCSSQKDHKKLIQQIQNQILQNTKEAPRFSSKPYQTLSLVLSRLYTTPNFQSPKSGEEEIDSLLEELKEIQDGNPAFPQSFTLESNTPFWKQDLLNKVHADLKFAHKALDGHYPQDIQDSAIQSILESENLDEKQIHKLTHIHPSPQSAGHILNTLIQKGYKLGEGEVVALAQNAQFSKQDFLHFANICKSQYAPDLCISLFERLSQENPNAKLAYLFILLDFSMFQKAQEFIHSEDNGELTLAKAYLDLKEAGKTYPLSLFFNFY